MFLLYYFLLEILSIKWTVRLKWIVHCSKQRFHGSKAMFVQRAAYSLPFFWYKSLLASVNSSRIMRGTSVVLN